MISQPIMLMPVHIDDEQLGKAILGGLNSSRTLNEREEDEYYLKDLLRIMKESSYNKLYANSQCCSISLTGNVVRLTPYKYMGRGQGIEEQEQLTIEMSADDYTAVANKARQVLLG